MCEVEYVVDCIRDYTSSSNPVLLTGTHSGALHLLKVDNSAEDLNLHLVTSLADGHTTTVRCQQWDAQRETLLTGAEDSLLCLWSPPGSPVKTGPINPCKIRAKLKSSKSKKGKPY
ncbi:WD repeat-containing protein 89-like [Liolophura sinensis]|uniref:WD repeat-containing protein 89-like n=1 Tax=Liolophura sinensis TaxID=3198878 RepID=UPI0031581027